MDDQNKNQTNPEDVSEVDVVVEETTSPDEENQDSAVVVESETVETEPSSSTDSLGAPENEAETMLKLDSLIKRYISTIEKLKQEMKTHRDMFNDAVANDAAYSENEAKAKEANRLKNAAKQNIVKQPAVSHLQEKMQEVKEEMKDMQDALVDYVQEYERISGVNFIETEDGIIHEIVKSVRLVKKGASGKKH